MESIYFVHVDESELGYTQTVVLAELGGIGELTAVVAQVRRNEALQPSGLEDTLATNEDKDLVVDDVITHP